MFDALFFMRNTPPLLRLIFAFGLFFPSVNGGVLLGDMLFIILRYGLDAYSDGLRFASSKHGALTDGTELTFLEELFRIPLVLFMVFGFMFVVLWAIDYLIGQLRNWKSLD